MYTKAILSLFISCFLFAEAHAMGEIECPPEGVSFVPAENCSQYYICAEGHPDLKTCPNGLYFNPAIHECDYEINVPECSGGTRPPPTGAPTTGTTIVSTTTTESTTTPTTTPTTVAASTTTEQPSLEPLRNCGETIVANVGSIEYKLNEEYSSSEKCAFIIRTRNHSGFIFTLEEHGLYEDPTILGGPISIFSFGNHGLLDTVHLGPPNPLTQAYVSGSAVVVVFRSEDYVGTGFRLKFEGTGTFSSDGFEHWDDTIRSDVPAALDYPSSGSFYEDNTLSLFVISNNHTSIVSLYDTLQIFLTSADLDVCGQNCDCDFLSVYSFQGDSIELLQRLCTESEQINFITKGIFILLFRSDSGIKIKNGNGFSMEWKIVES